MPIVPLGTEFLVNTNTLNSQNAPAIASLASTGGFVVTWHDSSGTLGDASGTSIKTKVYTAKGALVRDEFLVNTAVANSQFTPTVTGLRNGDFVIAWGDWSEPLGSASDSNIRAKVFNSAGAVVRDDFRVNFFPYEVQQNPDIAALANGGFVVAWNQYSSSNSSDVHVAIRDASGTALTEGLATAAIGGYQGGAQVTGLTDGNLVLTWTDDTGTQGDPYGTAVKARILNAAGGVVKDDFLVNYFVPNNQRIPAITALANGGFVVTWEDSSGTQFDTSGTSINARIFNAAGGFVTFDTRINTQTLNDQLQPKVAGLANGGFVVVWSDGSGTLGDSTYSIKAKAFNATGGVLLDEVLVNTQTSGNQRTPDVTALEDGGFVVTWEDPSGTLGDASGTSIKAQIFTFSGITVTGTSGPDTLLGSEGGDTIIGYDGDDQGHGGLGHDTISGGDGNDYLNGGLGDDWLDGGAGNDTVLGDGGSDYLQGGLDDDLIGGSGGNDTVLGDAGNDYMNGGLGDDLVMGGTGADTVFGAEGNDYLHGGDGDDLIGGSEGNDVLIGDTGNDYLNGGVENDIIGGGDGNDTVIGDVGDDYLSAGPGDDVLGGGPGKDTLFAGSGSDYLVGGDGDDHFIFDGGFQTSQIIDFTPGPGLSGHDTIQFSTAVFANYADMMAHAAQVATNVVITDRSGNTLLLASVNLSSLVADDFSFG
ncbi:MAG TPA: calcium-binding protein [Beijerinckiaceae bacterium]|jgi:Ca2+-binding RTX toxin-like protein